MGGEGGCETGGTAAARGLADRIFGALVAGSDGASTESVGGGSAGKEFSRGEGLDGESGEGRMIPGGGGGLVAGVSRLKGGEESGELAAIGGAGAGILKKTRAHAIPSAIALQMPTTKEIGNAGRRDTGPQYPRCGRTPNAEAYVKHRKKSTARLYAGFSLQRSVRAAWRILGRVTSNLPFSEDGRRLSSLKALVRMSR